MLLLKAKCKIALVTDANLWFITKKKKKLLRKILISYITDVNMKIFAASSHINFLGGISSY